MFPNAAPFWMVWREGGGAPTYPHDSYKAASAEAERLARTQPGAKFTVLEAVSSHRAVSMEVIDLRPDRGLPF